jgi:hypothetical protein
MHKQITSECLAQRDPAFLVRIVIAIEDRAGEPIAKHGHCILESDAVLGAIACGCLADVPFG